jgi:hypothetical protein
MQHADNGTTDDFAQRQAGGSGISSQFFDQTARELDGKGDLGISDSNGLLELLSLLEIALRLDFGNGPGLNELIGGLRKTGGLLEYGPGEIEAFGELNVGCSGPAMYHQNTSTYDTSQVVFVAVGHRLFLLPSRK